MNMKQLAKQLLILCAVFLTTIQAHAFLELNETAELIPNDGKYRVGFFPQLYISNGGGTNFGAFMDMYVDDAVNARFTLGGGATDFWAGASAKWVPFPDYHDQPALGFRGAFTYAYDNNQGSYNSQVTPIVSKVIETKFGKLNPYMGLPVTWVYVSSTSSFTAIQFVVGSEWLQSPDFQMGGELEMNMQNSTSALSVYFNFPFDEKTGFKK